MIKLSQKQPSYFEGMEIGDELPIINSDRMKVVFEKSSNESGSMHVSIDNKIDEKFEIEYDFDNFPTLREQFIKRIRYIFLKDFSVADFQNADLKDTKLSLVTKDLDLGYGISIVKTDVSDLIPIYKEIQKAAGAPTDKVPNDPARLLPEDALQDFVYTVYVKNGNKRVPMGFFSIPFKYADEVYDLNTLDEIRDFFIDLTESQLQAPIEMLAKKLKEKMGITDIGGPFERLDSGNLNAQDILNFYNEKSKELEPNSPEARQLIANTESLIKRLHQGESITKEDLAMNFKKPAATRNVEHVKDYRKMILLSGIEKKINAIESAFEQRIKSETDDAKINNIKKQYFSLKTAISDIKEKMDTAKDIQPFINDINVLLQKAMDFIKK